MTAQDLGETVGTAEDLLTFKASASESQDGETSQTPLDSREGASAPAQAGAPPLPRLKDHKWDRATAPNDNQISGSEKRTVFALVANVAWLVENLGLERVGFLTLTTADTLNYWTREGWREALSRFANFRRRAVPTIFGSAARWVCVAEPQRRGAIHWHLVIECPGDIRTGVDFAAFKREDYSSAPKVLRSLWSQLRDFCPRYDLGRHELMPIRETGKTLANYVGKYITKSVQREWVEGKFEGLRRPPKTRRVRYSQGWRVATTRIAWVNGGGRIWRQGLARLAKELNIKEMSGFKILFGSRWAYFLGESIMAAGQPVELVTG